MTSAGLLRRKPIRTHSVSPGGNGISETTIEDFIGEGVHASDSFGLQWTRYRDVQIDRLNGSKASWEHLRAFAQGDLSVFDGAVCLEVGSGAGRFTEYLTRMCRVVISVDASEAVFANAALGAPNLIACRADLFDVPVRREAIDVVMCRGVVQHTASPRRAIEKLFEYVRPGGTVLFDVYPLKWYTPLLTKYWLRPVTCRIPSEVFGRWAERWVPVLLRAKHRVVNRMLPSGPLGRHLSNQLVPIADFTRSRADRPWEEQVQWSILDTIDMYTPRFDRPMTYGAVMRTLRRIGAEDVQADRSSFCFRARAPHRATICAA